MKRNVCTVEVLFSCAGRSARHGWKSPTGRMDGHAFDRRVVHEFDSRARGAPGNGPSNQSILARRGLGTSIVALTAQRHMLSNDGVATTCAQESPAAASTRVLSDLATGVYVRIWGSQRRRLVVSHSKSSDVGLVHFEFEELKHRIAHATGAQFRDGAP
jgi:hypothetical protein